MCSVVSKMSCKIRYRKFISLERIEQIMFNVRFEDKGYRNKSYSEKRCKISASCRTKKFLLWIAVGGQTILTTPLLRLAIAC